MSDLQCPVIVVLLTPETAIDSQFPDRRLAVIFVASSLSVGTRAVMEANRLAAEHGCRVEIAMMSNGSELAKCIEDIADGFRGETVAVVAPSDAVCDALEWVDPPTQPVAIAIDNDGHNLIK